MAAFLFGEQIGRKRSIIYANILVVIGATIMTASFGYGQMIAARKLPVLCILIYIAHHAGS